jgi:hypothetical protein
MKNTDIDGTRETGLTEMKPPYDDSVLSVAQQVHDLLRDQQWPDASGIAAFGLETSYHNEALRHAVCHDGVTARQLAAALGNKFKIFALISPTNPYRSGLIRVHFLPFRTDKQSYEIPGKHCPECESPGPFLLDPFDKFTVAETGEVRFPPEDWGLDIDCDCPACGLRGRLEDFIEWVEVKDEERPDFTGVFLRCPGRRGSV